jgi:hypothetical protein
MPDDVAALKAEIARLRSVCEEFDVDPDWKPEPPLYWVMTKTDAMLSSLTRSLLPSVADRITRPNPLLDYLMRNQP